MKCLVDEALPRSMAKSLRAEGIDAVDVRDVGLKGRSDDEVFAYAVQHGYCLLTLDRDFAGRLRFPPQPHPGILLGRFPETISSPVLVREITRLLIQLAGEDLRQTVVILGPGRIRLRRVPGGP